MEHQSFRSNLSSTCLWCYLLPISKPQKGWNFRSILDCRKATFMSLSPSLIKSGPSCVKGNMTVHTSLKRLCLNLSVCLYEQVRCQRNHVTGINTEKLYFPARVYPKTRDAVVHIQVYSLYPQYPL